MRPKFSKKVIRQAKTIGQRLRAARTRQGYSLSDAERLTKVKLKYLKALEQDHHDQLPSEVYSLGFLRCYSETLGLNTKKMLEQYRAERGAFKTAKTQFSPTLAPGRSLRVPLFTITPKVLATFFSAILVIGLLVYIASGVRSFLAPPSLAIEEPKPDSRVGESTVLVKGQTDPAASLKINNEYITVDPDGNFSQTIILLPGLNVLEFIATNRVGKETKQTRKILATFSLSSPSPTPSFTPSATPTPVSSISPSPKPSTKTTS